MNVSDYNLVGLYVANMQFTVQGDTNSIVSHDQSTHLSTYIEVKGCNPAAVFPSAVPPITVMIGTPTTIDMQPYF